jgi:hypothetical protein
VKKDQKMAVVSHRFRSYMCFVLSQLRTCGQCRRALSPFSLLSLTSKSPRDSVMLMRSRSWGSATRMAVVARRTAKRPLNGTAQL